MHVLSVRTSRLLFLLGAFAREHSSSERAAAREQQQREHNSMLEHNNSESKQENCTLQPNITHLGCLTTHSLRMAFVFACRGPSCPSCPSVAVRTPMSARKTTSWRAGRRAGGQPRAGHDGQNFGFGCRCSDGRGYSNSRSLGSQRVPRGDVWL